jgi:colanic acid/amylovoran biosynthesis protein
MSGKRVMVLTIAGWGSVGDHALVCGAVQSIQAAGDVAVVGAPSDGARWRSALDNLGVAVVDMRSGPGLLRCFVELLRADRLVVIGADVIDGVYVPASALKRLGMAAFASRLGKATAVASFSFSSKPNPAVVERMKAYGARISYRVRDRRSLTRFVAATGLPAEQTADLGFQVRPRVSQAIAELDARLKAARESGQVVIGVNLAINKFHGAAIQNNPDTLVGVFARVIERFASGLPKGLALAIVPHDFRHPELASSDVALANALQAKLAPFPSVETHLSASADSRDIRRLAEHFDLVLSCRMHFSILSLSAGAVPVTVGYLDKFEGMFEHFGLDPEKSVIKFDSAAELESKLESELTNTFGQLETLRAAVQNQIERVRGLAMRNTQ